MSMKAVPRIGVSLIPGALVTFGLLVLMFTLIATGNKELDEEESRKIADIFQPEREVTERQKQEKPDKPEQPDEPPPDMPEQQEKFEAPKGAVSMTAPGAGTNVDVGMGGGFARDTDYIPVYVPQPQYPRRAQSRGVSGYAVVEVTITKTGSVKNIKLMEEHPDNYGFGRAAMRAADKLKYNPRVVNGEPQEVPGVLYKFTFRIQE